MTDHITDAMVEAPQAAPDDTANLISALSAKLAEVERERDELQETFDIRWEADRRATKEWQEVTGQELTWPDHVDLVCFLATRRKLGEALEGAIADIAAERRRQIEAEGWSQDHDDAHRDGEMARAAGIYAVIAGSDRTDYRNATGGYRLTDILQAIMDHYWPWDRSWFKPTNPRRDLVKAGALIVAEIERLDRAARALTSDRATND